MNEPLLPPHYYLDNFRFLVDWVADQYGDLLNEDESRFIHAFNQLPRDSQCLLVRMISRKGVWFRANKLRYADIENHQQAAEQLMQAGMASIDIPLSLTEVGSLLTKPELLLLFADHLRLHKHQRKDALIEYLSSLYPEPATWATWTTGRLDQLYRLDVQHISDTLLLLFFGNPRQDLTEFVLQDMGIFRYEKYTIDKRHRLFKSRHEIAQYQELTVLRDHFANVENLASLEQLLTLVPEKFDHPAMERRRAKLCNQLAYELERYGQLEAALALYQQVELPPARERQVRLLEKLGHTETAWALLNTIIANPANEHELQLAQRMAPRLAKKNCTTFTRPIQTSLIEQRLILHRLMDEEGHPLSVEAIAQHYFDTPASPCFYAENLLLNGLFGLWLWPEMFRSIDGAFTHPFQSAPLDLYQENFLSNRPGIAELWKLLDNSRHADHIKQHWHEKFGITNHFVHWQFLDEHLIHLALECIPAKHLKAIFQRLLFDLKANRSGFPDLVQFFPAQQQYRLIEIKGPGDRLQDNQLRWLDFFSAQKIPAEVCYVSWH